MAPKDFFSTILEKDFFPQYFPIYLSTSGVKLHIHLLNVTVRFIVFLNSANFDMSRYGYFEVFQRFP